MTQTEYNKNNTAKENIKPDSVGAKDWSDFEAIKKWQTKHGLKSDGYFGPKSVEKWLELNKVLTKPITGVDISGHNKISKGDFIKMKAAGHRFIWIKGTEGTGYVFKKACDLSTEAQEAGLVIGFYHFAQPSREKDDAINEAKWFVKNVFKCLKGDLPHVLDLESNKANLTKKELIDWAKTWLQTVEQMTGTKPIIYTYTAFWKGPLGKTNELEQWELWQAEYNNNPKPTQLGNWDANVWQYTSKGTIPGVQGHFDINKFLGTEEEFKKFCNV